ncbi:NAD-dependent succinate-semialdehyde dehydrogenase [Aspergillus fischeri NRRL 181]|uniref:Succinate semialdehyde dehydrogenase n=1 Tax=Neosartorya fischeri (strain ATCC 1020 / DSM 3700 / CBS 544.65 / FGSC A1164 / JCM 1740 / NRRL 181 / WB 181) TaxID=331117 RepID=A1D0S1_NEOFI|nr:succinate semialdehyde dehydrogenase [Aspergillus fischeri NRRL 181]EAW24591.1 succinate semialdehyde dehydrogenase [Aspergillus fischeri NRRL 181]
MESTQQVTAPAPELLDLKNPALLVTSGLINGQEIKGAEGKTFPVIEPSSATVLAHCADLSKENIIAAIEAADKGYVTYYETTTARERGLFLKKFYHLMLDNADDLARILSLENGKTIAEARGEINYAASFVSWFAEEATRAYGDTIPSSYAYTEVFTLKEPVGVALALGKLAIAAGIPADCIHIVPTSDRQAASELAANAKVKKLSFTGSTRVGKTLTTLAAQTMKRVSMELGGNAPFIVLEDANLDQAVAGVMVCKFRSSGQTCVCANRILVHENVQEAFIAKLIQKVRTLKLGRGIDIDTTQGPLVNAAAVKKVAEHVQDAISKGAILHTGGKSPSNLSGFFYEPTVISGVTPDMTVAYEETFGPLAAIFSFKSEQEAVDLANATEFGLAGYFFSENVGRVMRVARRLECGMVGVNTGLISAAESPFGGIKESGLGREGSKYGLQEYQNIKSVTLGNLQA